MKVLITGGAGYIGSVLVPMLLEKGFQVRVIDNLLYGGHGLLYSYFNPNFEFINGDITNRESVKEAIKGTDIIIHLAAIVGYPACKKHIDLAKKVNTDGTRIICEERNENQQLHFASTGSVYGAINGPCTEDTQLNPLSIYGQTKKEAEDIIIESGNAAIYRFATAFGLSPRLRLDLLVNNFVYQAIKEKQLVVYEKNFLRTFIHVRDICSSFIFGIENFSNIKNEVYNVGNENMNFTKEELVRKISEKVEFYLHFADFDGDEDKRNYFVSYEKIRNKGFYTQITLDRGLNELHTGLSALIQYKSFFLPYSNTIMIPYSENAPI